MTDKAGLEKLSDLARKGWTAEEEERLLQLLAEFVINRGPGRRKKGKEKFAPMARKLNRDFYHIDRKRYPFRTWENLRVKCNNLKSKYEGVKRKSMNEHQKLDLTRAIQSWRHFVLCDTVFSTDFAGKDEQHSSRSCDDDTEGQVSKEAQGLTEASELVSRADDMEMEVANGNPELTGPDALIRAIQKIEKTRDRQAVDTERVQEERERKVQIEIERLRLETRNIIELEIERLRQEHQLRLKELEVKLILLIHHSSESNGPVKLSKPHLLKGIEQP